MARHVLHARVYHHGEEVAGLATNSFVDLPAGDYIVRIHFRVDSEIIERHVTVRAGEHVEVGL